MSIPGRGAVQVYPFLDGRSHAAHFSTGPAAVVPQRSAVVGSGAGRPDQGRRRSPPRAGCRRSPGPRQRPLRLVLSRKGLGRRAGNGEGLRLAGVAQQVAVESASARCTAAGSNAWVFAGLLRRQHQLYGRSRSSTRCSDGPAGPPRGWPAGAPLGRRPRVPEASARNADPSAPRAEGQEGVAVPSPRGEQAEHGREWVCQAR